MCTPSQNGAPEDHLPDLDMQHALKIAADAALRTRSRMYCFPTASSNRAHVHEPATPHSYHWQEMNDFGAKFVLVKAVAGRRLAARAGVAYVFAALSDARLRLHWS